MLNRHPREGLDVSGNSASWLGAIWFRRFGIYVALAAVAALIVLLGALIYWLA